jgi:CHAT domain-containing protein
MTPSSLTFWKTHDRCDCFPTLPTKCESNYALDSRPSSHCPQPAVGQNNRKRVFAIGSMLMALSCAGYAQSQEAAKPIADADDSIFTTVLPDDCQAPTDADLIKVKAVAESFRSKGERQNQLRALILLGSLYERIGEYKQALPFLESARPMAKDSSTQAEVLTLTADALSELGEPIPAAADASAAWNLSKKSGDIAAEAAALRALAESQDNNSTRMELQYLKEALPLSDRSSALKTEAIILNDEAEAESDSGDPFSTYDTALKLEDRIHDCREKVATLTNLATLELDRGQLRAAFDHLDQAQALEQQVGDHVETAQLKHQWGYFYWELGDLGQALTFFNDSLAIKQQAGALASEADTLGALAGVYRDAKWPNLALPAYLKVLPMFEHTKNVQWQVWVLNNLGQVEADLHHPIQARSYYNRAVQLAPTVNDRSTPAYAAWGIGELEEADALPSYFRALRMAREFGQPDLEGEVDSSLMLHFRAHNQPNVAIFFGKRAVDQFQSLRRNMDGMNNELTSTFLQIKSATYRTLAEILIEQKRLVEAQQVLDLLKIQQFSDYVGGQASQLAEQLPRSPREAPLEQGFEDQVKRLTALHDALQAAEDARPLRAQAVLQARTAVKRAEAGFSTFLQDLYRQLESPDGPQASVQAVSGAELPLQRLIDADPRMAVLYTLEGVDRYSVIVISHAGRVPRWYKISQSDLDAKCQRFLALLDHTGSDIDVAASAQDLFDILFGPVKDDLRAMGVTTLVWSLDGSLRYIPIAALQDKTNHRYLVQDFTIVNFSPLGRSLEDVPQLTGARGVAMGVSTMSVDGLPYLHYVPSELYSVVADPDVKESHGVLPGKILLNEQFTQQVMEQQVRSKAVVHIASHFVLEPGNDQLSYLLIGNEENPEHEGHSYSMADLANDNEFHIDGTKLFTLSACQTGAANRRAVCFEPDKSSVITAKCEEDDGNQRENGVVMESISELVLGKGAEAVISSLWHVDDPSTSKLMADFYWLWVDSGGKLSKAEALRDAELDLLYGKEMAQPDASGRGISPDEPKTGQQASPPPYAHPHYWAPFVLTGNWK